MTIVADLGGHEGLAHDEQPMRGLMRDVIANGPEDGVVYLTHKSGAKVRAWPEGLDSVWLEIPRCRLAYEDLCELNAFTLALLSWVNAMRKYAPRGD